MTRSTSIILISVVAICLFGCKAKCPKGSALHDGQCFWPQADGGQSTVPADGSVEIPAAHQQNTGPAGQSGGVASRGEVSGLAASAAGTPAGSIASAGNSGTVAAHEIPVGGMGPPPLVPDGAGTVASEASNTNASAPEQCVASIEQCDNADNDCDGKIDEEVSRPCGSNIGECRPGTLSCNAGKWDDETTQCRGAIGPAEEDCDASRKDENCDGSSNEGCSCTEGETMPCGNATPPCRQGTLDCVDGRFSATCRGEIKGSAETCDGRDNDCNGSIDENVKNECGGCARLSNPPGSSCSAGSNACKSNGRYQCSGDDATSCDAVALPASSEECDNTDNDCDGRIDESLKNDCGGPCDVRLLHSPGESCNKPVPGKPEACAKQGKYECQGTSTVACTAAASAPTVGNCGCDWTCVCPPAGSSTNPNGDKCPPGETKTIYSEGYPPGMCKPWLCMTRDTACSSSTPSC